MAAGADESKGRELTHSSEVQLPDSADDDLRAKIASMEETIALCNMVCQDLLSVQRIVKEKGLCEASFQEQENQVDFTP